MCVHTIIIWIKASLKLMYAHFDCQKLLGEVVLRTTDASKYFKWL